MLWGQLESEVLSYSRSFPAVFDTARGARMRARGGREYLDFFSGAGALNYGHNPPALKRALLGYLERDGVLHALDMQTLARQAFLERFGRVVLRPRGLDYRVQLTGPTGTNCVEAALKLARKVTGRSTVVAFEGGYHGCTLGSLAVSSNRLLRGAAGVPLEHACILPFDDAGLDALQARLADRRQELPAAAIVETIQAEGGVRVATSAWLQRLSGLCARHRVLLIVDDVQVGCGRTGDFFSFEQAGITPDLVCLSKSLSGYGLPMAALLIAPRHDRWAPGEHNGTFRGHSAAFVTATAALDHWEDGELGRGVAARAALAAGELGALALRYRDAGLEVRGRGLIQGLDLRCGALAGEVRRLAFEGGLLVETCGPDDSVVKLLPPLTIDEDDLRVGLSILRAALQRALEGFSGVEEVTTGPRGAVPAARTSSTGRTP